MLRTSCLAATLFLLVLQGMLGCGRAEHSLREQYSYAVGVGAVLETYPVFLNSLLMYQWSQAPTSARRPSEAFNQFFHARHFTDPNTYRDGGMPNRDTLYSVAWVEVADAPVILTVPEIRDRFYSVEIADFFSDNIAYVSSRAGSEAGRYAIVPPHYDQGLPADVMPLVTAPTRYLFILVRIFADPDWKADVEAVHRLQAGFALEAGGGDDAAAGLHAVFASCELDPLASSPAKFQKRVAVKDPLFYWRVINAFLADSVAAGYEFERLDDWSELQIGASGDLGKARDVEIKGLRRAVRDGLRIIKDYTTAEYGAHIVNGWEYPPVDTGRLGSKGAYLARAAIQSMMGIVANDATEAVYMLANRDARGKRLSGDHAYELVMSGEEMPVVSEFWSITMYDADGNLVSNSAGRYSVSSHEELVTKATDGIRIVIANRDPNDGGAIWLPAPADEFSLVLRAYGPDASIVDQTWQPPAIAIRGGR
jgi:hypothetical protein